MQVHPQVEKDLRFVAGFFPLRSLQHVVANRHRLIRRAYTDGKGGCLFFLLSELLPPELRIQTREELTRFFTGGSGAGFKEQAVYQPAKWLVRLIDGETVARYDNSTFLPWHFVISVLEQVIEERLAGEAEEQRVAEQVEARLALRRRRPAHAAM